ncbi:MAG: asparagine--tRNA ligase [Nitrososphaeraceae archaeon]
MVTRLMYYRANDIKHDDFIGKSIRLRGWVYRIRKQKDKNFVLIRDDRGGVIQCVFPSNIGSDLTIESSLEVKGTVLKDERAKEGGYEIRSEEIKVINIAPPDFPIGEFQSTELLLDNRHLAIRSRKMVAMSKIRATVLQAARQWFIDNDWIEVNVPTIVKSAVEGGSTLFSLKYYDDDAYLSQSAQLYLEALVFSLGPVWTLAPSFRAEKSRTVRHLAEFLHLEAESPWIEMDDLLRNQEKLLCGIVHEIILERSEDLKYLNVDLSALNRIHEPFDRLKYDKAIEILQSMEIKVQEGETTRPVVWGDDLNIDSERAITREKKSPIFIVGYPLQVKPFYVKEDPLNLGVALSTDLLLPDGFGEVSSGGIREDNIENIRTRLKEQGLDLNSYSWYLDLRKYGSVPHGGFGIGIERLIRWIINSNDIKECVLFPRTMSRVMP